MSRVTIGVLKFSKEYNLSTFLLSRKKKRQTRSETMQHAVPCTCERTFLLPGDWLQFRTCVGQLLLDPAGHYWLSGLKKL